jgi:hypothetical protein
MRRKQAKDGWLTAEWSKKENDILFHFPRSCDGHLLHQVLTSEFSIFRDKSFIQELRERGYDIETLQFSVRRNPTQR